MPDIGDTIGGYRLLRLLGQGGFGSVFLGQAADGRQAAVKLLRQDMPAGEHEEFRERFAREADAARKVSRFCIAGVLDADPNAPQPWIASEFVDGPTLRAAVHAEGPRTGAVLHRLAVSTATALTAIHRAGVVHRDFKPDNIILAPDGPRVIDFGIARAFASTALMASAVIGTVAYMAPEQFEDQARLTPAVDVFAWGAVMVFAATGRDAFAATGQASVIRKVTMGEPDCEEVPTDLLPVVRRCLRKDPAARPSARELLDLLLGNGHGDTPDGAATLIKEPTGPPVVPPVSRSVTGPVDTPATPPFEFVHRRYVSPRELAGAMRNNWAAATQVFAGEHERGALRDWAIDDVADTTVDRALLRTPPKDPDLAVARFIAQLRPDLSPVYKGNDMALSSLRQAFDGNGSLLPLFNGVFDQVVDVLRVMAKHHCVEKGHPCPPGHPCAEYRHFAEAMAVAESAGAEYRAWFDTVNKLVEPRVRFTLTPHRVAKTLLTDWRQGLSSATSKIPSTEWRDAVRQSVGSRNGPQKAGTHVAAIHASGHVREIAVFEAKQREKAASGARFVRERDSAQKIRKRYATWSNAAAVAAAVVFIGLMVVAFSTADWSMFWWCLALIPVSSFGVLLIGAQLGNSKAKRLHDDSLPDWVRESKSNKTVDSKVDWILRDLDTLATRRAGLAHLFGGGPTKTRRLPQEEQRPQHGPPLPQTQTTTLRSQAGGMVFSPDGARLAVTLSGDIDVFDTATTHRLTSLRGKELGRGNPIGAVAFSDGGDRLAAAGTKNNGSALVWSVATAELVDIVDTINIAGAVSAMAFSPDDALLAVASDDRLLHMTRVRTGQLRWRRPCDTPAVDPAFSSNGHWLAVTGTKGTVLLVDPRNGSELLSCSHSAVVRSVAFSPDSRSLVTTGGDFARIWDPETGVQRMALPHEKVHGAVFSGDSRVATIDSAGTVRVWDSRSGTRIAESGSDSTVTNALLSPDGERMAVLSGTTLRISALPMGAD